MTSHESPGFLHRMLSTLGRALGRGILGKSSHDYMKQFSGSDEYWDRVIAARLGWPEEQPPKPDPNPIHSSGHAVVRARPGVRSSVLSSAAGVRDRASQRCPIDLMHGNRS